MRNAFASVVAGLVLSALSFSPVARAASAGLPGAWQAWQPGNDISNTASLQRGAGNFMGYCAGCHSLKYVRYSRLAEDLSIPEAQMEKLLILPGAKKGDYITTPLSAADAEAWFGKAPPDLSLMTKARPDGTNYVYSLLTGYSDDVPKGWTKPDTLYYNPYFHSVNIAMPPPLAADGQVTYSDGSPATTDQYAKDVSAFLTWTAEPKLENRKETGMAVILFLIIMTGLGYLSYRKVWADIKKA